jgi:hypothetical protein
MLDGIQETDGCLLPVARICPALHGIQGTSTNPGFQKQSSLPERLAAFRATRPASKTTQPC